MIRKALMGALLLTAIQAQADYSCNVTPRNDVVLTAQSVQVTGENGNLVIAPDGSVQYNGKPYNLDQNQRQQALNYQQALRSDLPWIDKGALDRVDKARQSLDNIIARQVGESSKMRGRLTDLDAQLKKQLNRIIEHRPDGLTFHYKGIDQVRADGQQLVNTALGGILQDSINEMGAQALLKKGAGGNPLEGVLGSLGGLQTAIQNEWNNQQNDFEQFGRDVCSKVTALEQQRSALVATLK